MASSPKITAICGFGTAVPGLTRETSKDRRVRQVLKAFKGHRGLKELMVHKDCKVRPVRKVHKGNLDPKDYRAYREKRDHKAQPEHKDRRGNRAFKVSRDRKDRPVRMVLTVLQSPSKEVQRQKPNYPTQGIQMAMVTLCRPLDISGFGMAQIG
jgi:hypothetical protein